MADYVKQVIHKSLNGDSFDEKRIEHVERNFVKALNGEPLKSQVKAKLSGIILKSKKINLKNLIKISKEFSIDSGLLKNKKMIKIIDKIDGEASMIMLGNAIFSDKHFKGSKKLLIKDKGAYLL